MQHTKPRNKQLSSTELQTLRNEPQLLYLNQKEFVLYNLVDKQSNTGIFKNERMLVLNVRKQSLSYLSKIPNGLIPFHTEEEVESQTAKQKVTLNEVRENQTNKFQCRQLEDKNGIEIKLNIKDRKIQWIFFYKNKAVMKEWFRHVNFIFTKNSADVHQKYHYLPTNQPTKIKGDAEKHLQQPLDKQATQNEKGKDEHMPVDGKQNQFKKQLSRHPQKQSNQKDNRQSASLNLQSVQQLQKGSQFNQFVEDSPLGSFIRSNNDTKRQFQTEPLPNESKTINYIVRSPTALNNPPNHFPFTKSQTNYNIVDSMKGSNVIPIDANEKNKNQKRNFNSETLKLGSIRKNKLQNTVGYPKQDVSFNNSNSAKNLQHNSPIHKQSKQNQISTEWNKMYYSDQPNQLNTYLSFLQQCSSYFQSLVDQLPIARTIVTFEKQGNYYYTKNNGIYYIIAYENFKEESLIYQLSENTPIVLDNYEIYDNLKRQFVEEKETFFKNQTEHPSLIALIQFKGLMSFCKALNKDQKPQQKPNKQIPQTDFEQALLTKIQSMDIHITSSTDFISMMRKANISEINWAYLYNNTKFKCYKRIFLNQILSEVFQNIIRNQLCHIYQQFPADQFEQVNLDLVNDVVLDCALMMINRLFGRGPETDTLWTVLFEETERRFSVKPKIQNVLEGYLLYSIASKIGLDFISDIKLSSKLGTSQKKNKVDRSYIKGFKPLIYCLNYEEMSDNLLKIVANLQLKTTEANNDQLQLLINSTMQQIPQQINYLQPQIHLKLSNTHPYNRDIIEENDIYSILSTDKPSYEHYQIIVSAVKWSLKNNEISHAEDIAFLQIQQILFWIGKIPLISHFYDAIAQHYINSGQLDLAIQWIKKSIHNLIEVFSLNDPSILQKRFILAELNLQINHRQQSLKELYECKRICEEGNLTNNSIYMDTLISISKLTLSLSKFNDSVNNSLECLKHLQRTAQIDNKFQNGESAAQFLSVSQLLLRAFELTNRRQQLYQIGHLCLQRCQNVNSIKIYKKMFKIFLFPYLKRLNFNESQCLLVLVQQLDGIYKESNYNEKYLYECMKDKKILSQMDKRISAYFKSVCSLYDQIIKRRILQEFNQKFSDYLKAQKNRNDPIIFTCELFLIVNLVGVSFVQALLKDVYYE